MGAVECGSIRHQGRCYAVRGGIDEAKSGQLCGMIELTCWSAISMHVTNSTSSKARDMLSVDLNSQIKRCRTVR
jgi:hypothetical protein